MALDPRIVRVSIEVDGQIKTYEGLNIEAKGTKYANAIQNECEVKISNIKKDPSGSILTETSPFNFNHTPKRFTIEAGRQSYGTTVIYTGDVTSSKISQAPDTTIELKAKTGNFQKGNIIARNQPAQAPLSILAKQVAQDLSLNLNFQAVDKQIANYAYAGAALKQVEKLGQMGAVNAFVDDASLIIQNLNTPIPGAIRVLNVDSGMVGIPETTEEGIKVTYFLDNLTVLGGLLRVQSRVYPAVNGDYIIFKLGFEITNRQLPFYWVAEAKRL